MMEQSLPLQASPSLVLVRDLRSLFPKATLNADECWVSSLNPTYGREAIASVQASLMHVIVGGAVDRSYPVGNRSWEHGSSERYFQPTLNPEKSE